MNAQQILSIVWEIAKVAIIPLGLYYIQRLITQRDNEAAARDRKRESEYSARKAELDAQEKKNQDIQFLMMERIDSLSDMTQMMARKLHDAGIINGDLEHMNEKYEKLNSDYEKSLKGLALKVLNKKTIAEK